MADKASGRCFSAFRDRGRVSGPVCDHPGRPREAASALTSRTRADIFRRCLLGPNVDWAGSAHVAREKPDSLSLFADGSGAVIPVPVFINLCRDSGSGA